jgi:hypothetical protein
MLDEQTHTCMSSPLESNCPGTSIFACAPLLSLCCITWDSCLVKTHLRRCHISVSVNTRRYCSCKTRLRGKGYADHVIVPVVVLTFPVLAIM